MGSDFAAVLGDKRFVALNMVPMFVGIDNGFETEAVVDQQLIGNHIVPGIYGYGAAIIELNKVGKVI